MNEPLSGYYLVEQLGHNRYVGQVSEVIIAGAGFLRVDVPEVHLTPYDPAIPAFTKLIAPQSLFALTPLTYDEAMSAFELIRAKPHNLTPASRTYPVSLPPYDDEPAGQYQYSVTAVVDGIEVPIADAYGGGPYPRNSDGEFIAEQPEVPDHDEDPFLDN